MYPYDTSGITVGADGIRRYVTSPANLVVLLRETVDRCPEDVALAELGHERVTYAELWARAARVAGGLRDLGIERGDRVAIHLPNGNDWVYAWWGILLAGAVVVPVNTRFAQPEVDYVVGDSGASYVFEPDLPLPDGEPLVTADLDQAALAAICYTSGTTGFPKGAMTTHGNYLASIESCLRCWRFPEGERISTLIAVPLFHVTGCMAQLLTMTAVGGTSVIMPVFDVTVFLQTIERERISLVIGVPAILWLALQQPLFAEIDTSSVRAVLYGAAPVSPTLVEGLCAAFPDARLGNGFGLTECTGLATMLPHELAAERADSVGLPAPVVDVDLLDPDPVSGVGELVIRGPNVCVGYWGKEEQTRSTFVDGWLRTGDLARIDDEGLVYIADRKKDMINRGGENVYSVQVENVLAAHPQVGEVAVVGVPDQMMGEKVGAVVVPRSGATVDVTELLDFAATQLADFQVPQYVVVTSEPLPRNPSGKVVKPLLRETVEWIPVPKVRRSGIPAIGEAAVPVP